MSDERTGLSGNSEGTYDVVLAVTVRVRVADGRVIDRPVNNVDGWRDSLYDLRSADQVLTHLAYNCVVNGRTHADLMDGWADLPRHSVVMSVVDVETDEVFKRPEVSA